jgi:transposase
MTTAQMSLAEVLDSSFGELSRVCLFKLTLLHETVEGAVNKIKTHKRLMYDRASFVLLRQKLLHQVGST